MKSSNHPDEVKKIHSIYERMIGVFLFQKPLDDLENIIDQHFVGYGTAAHEFFQSLNEVEQMAQLQANQLQKTKVKMDRKLLQEKFVSKGLGYLIIEEVHSTIVADGHQFMMRVSTLLEKAKGKWKVTHFHGSTPDTNVDANEALPVAGLRKKNRELEEKIKARTRDLEIEAALERVRSEAMAMQTPDELTRVVDVLRAEMGKLGQQGIQASAINFYPDNQETFELWYAYRPASKKKDVVATGKATLPLKSTSLARKMKRLYLTAESEYLIHPKGKALQEWYDMLIAEIPGIAKQLDAERPKSIYWYFTDFSGGSFALTSVQKPAKESMQLQRKATAVFDLAYRRFLDLKRAEEQAREAQIESALERVRSRSLAMHQSAEIQEVVNTVFKEMKSLEMSMNVTSIFVLRSGKLPWEQWVASAETDYAQFFELPKLNHPVSKDLEKAIRKGSPFYTKRYTKKQKEAWFNYAFENTDYRKIPKKRKQYLLSSPWYEISFGLAKYTGIQIAKYEGESFSDDENSVLLRFTKVFEQAYVRFLDLQKAEAQAHEAQIEAALERVRSRSLAMHNSDELAEVVSVIYQQVAKFGLANWGCNIQIMDEDTEKIMIWLSDNPGAVLPRCFTFPAKGHPQIVKQWENWQKKIPTSVISLKGAAKKSYDDHVFNSTDFRHFSEEMKKGIRALHEVHFSFAWMKYGFIVSIHDSQPLDQDQFAILTRFARVFEQCYTRFLDLQKAEAQARESEIEAALERVRSRSLAMHNSDDLAGVISVVFKQLVALGFDAPACGLNLFDENNGMEMWISGFGDEIYPESFHIQYFDHPYYNHQLTAWKNGKEYDVLAFEGKLKKSYDKQTFLNPDFFDLPHHILEEFLAKSKVISCAAFMRHGMLEIISEEVISQDEAATLSRFAKVFEQTYTRFLDLQKAEAQAREAQIEAALERVRTQTMAMHTSQDVGNTMVVLFDELLKLGIKADRNGILIMKEDVSAELWTAKPIRNGEVELIFWKLDMTFHQMGKDAFDDWQNHNPITEYTLEGEDLLDYYKGINAAIDGPERFEMNSLPARQYASIYHFAEGSIYIFSAQTIPEEHSNILHRFASVFGQTYRRYLDLQKAEEQAREAQIEAALERVRSRSLAMHHSSELSAVVDTLLQEFTNLEFTLTFCIINLIDEQDMSNTVWAANPETGKDPESYYMKFEDYPFHHAMWDAWKAQKKRFIYTIEGEEKKKYDEYLYSETEFRRFPKHVQEANKALTRYVAGFTFFKHSGLQTVSEDKISEDDLNILERFGRVFEQVYTRFLDLQKAEAQAREAQIEAALERVRSQAMAMHQSEDLQRVVQVIYDQIKDLGFAIDSAQFDIFEQDSDDIHGWIATENYQYAQRIRTPYFQNPITDAYKAAKAKKPTTYNMSFSKTNSDSYWRHVFKHTDLSKLPAKRKKYLLSRAGINQMGAVLENLSLSINNYQGKHYAEEQTLTIKRFAEAFQQSYTRFLDLQKAETQAREAQIEAALERVRSASLAMHQTSELGDVVKVLFKQFSGLGLEFYQVWINIFKLEEGISNCWFSPVQGVFNEPYTAVIPLAPFEESSIKSWRAGEEFSYLSWQGREEVDRIAKELSKMTGHPSFKQIQQKKKMDRMEIVDCNHKYGVLAMAKNKDFTEEDHKILKRFTKVFQQAYTRFLDLEKAEAQAREARIEASLERVRAKTMAMHNSNDVGITVAVLFDELRTLGLASDARCGIGIFNHDNHAMELWTASARSEKDSTLDIGIIDMDWHPLLTGARNAWAQGNESYHYVLQDKDLKDYFKIINQAPDYSFKTDLKALPSKMHHYDFVFSEGIIFAFTNNPINDEIKSIFGRFAKVFDLTYRRYLDLVKAEAQAREAQIELSLERIRAQATAMQKSSDLLDIVVTMRSEFVGLGHSAHYFWHMKYNEDTYEKAMTSGDGSKIGMVMKLPRKIHGEIKQLAKWEISDQPTIVFTMNVDEALDYVHKMVSWGDFSQVDPKSPTDDDIRQIGGLTYVMARTMHGEIGYSLPGEVHNPPNEDVNTLKRFADAFDLAYRRFEDLQKAEVQTREATKQASIDRVRAEIASMRNTSDLERITPLIWKELITLGVPFFRCGVFIINEKLGKAFTYLSSPTGESLAVMALDIEKDTLAETVTKSWKANRRYREKWDKNQFKTFTQGLIDQGHIKDPKTYQQGEVAPELLNLHFAPFKQGMLYVGSEMELNEDQLALVQALANAFAVAYSRFEDFKQLEEAKASIEQTLGELRSTQTQLVHSEKMASLGELTAGIAHEIQNPLNFVNNFSEINKELLAELREAVASNDLEEVEALLKDLQDNEDKVTHHGKRAEQIVKSMLQHSRTGSGEKEQTDLNALCDEYLRLAYHGFRAKDKSFNADFKLNLDPTLSKVNVVSQDIGRVLLNLINNAFQAVKYVNEPEVSVYTKSVNGQIEVTVADNGPGIPDEIKDKIFQPFFTTKPTGEGTGLGLSMSYDIITKGHGGELKLNSNQGEGSEFIILLPLV